MAKKNKEKVQQPKQKKAAQYLFRADRQALKESQGWKKVKPTTAELAGAVSKGDLVLMEKNV